MADLEAPSIVVDLTRDNFAAAWPQLTQLAETSTFIALDMEMTGLGSKEGLRAPSLDDRYKAFRETATTRSIVSLGLSFFALRPATGQLEVAYDVRTFNILLLCQDPYTVEPGSLQFLTDNGFDFNKQIAKGVPYHSGQDRADQGATGPCVRKLFHVIAAGGATVVLHNGFIDLAFAYQQLYAPLPPWLQTFVADVVSLFAGGLVDTKYIADYHHREVASYLEFLFRKRLRENRHREQQHAGHVHVYFGNALDQGPAVPPTRPPAGPIKRTRQELAALICESYAFHGHCTKGSSCSLSHDLDLILDWHEAPKSKKRRKTKKKRGDGGGEESAEETTTGQNDEREGVGDVGSQTGLGGGLRVVDTRASAVAMDARYSHRAGFDAFMTGFIYAMDRITIDKETLAGLMNTLHLSYKQIPLRLIKSQFATTSRNHDLKSRANRPV